MDGVIVVNKPCGLSSSDACLKVKKILGLRKAGHLGTLDPLATGVLPLCINEGTKLVQFLVKSEKEYIATLQLGIETDTQDSQGAIVRETGDVPRNHTAIRAVFEAFRGELMQTPPMFSALKRNGTPLYKIARRGGWVHREQRKVVIHDIEVMRIEIPYVVFRVVCSHGTYIRTMCHDIGRRLLCGAHLTELKRVRNGSFHIRESVSLDEFDMFSREELIEKYLIPAKDALQGLPELTADSLLEQKIRNGAHITLQDIKSRGLSGFHRGQQIKILSLQGSLIAVVESLVSESTSDHCSDTVKAWKTLRVFLH